MLSLTKLLLLYDAAHCNGCRWMDITYVWTLRHNLLALLLVASRVVMLLLVVPRV